MFFHSAGYAGSQYNSYELRNTAARMAALIPALMKHTGAEFIVVTGKSGIMMAYATLMLIDFPLVVVRKDNENSHGSSVEGRSGMDMSKYLVLDDFTASGCTVQTIMDKLSLYSTDRWDRDLDRVVVDKAVECVGVLQYGQQYGLAEHRRTADSTYAPNIMEYSQDWEAPC